MSTGAQIIARALHDLGVQVIFGVPGLPVTDIGQEGLNLGIRFIRICGDCVWLSDGQAGSLYLGGRSWRLSCHGWRMLSLLLELK
jgi:hypothetical protein